MYDYKASPAQESIIRHSESSSAKAIPSSHPDARQRSPRSVVLKTPPSPLVPRSSPVRNSMSVRSLVHPSNSDGILHGDTRAFGCLPP
ncbi:unnamed protein product [Chondrus crispus]|uniref:Uncharacterized protein n=1 Tax=Chondrus crispus TaxID=2769 RepID=R7QIB1_CHOCR|nr:unnamed protein product [Chondrus crispus]CDF37216.1 unnamed protein product [Chondrus crispus]|eukprot:XP_005717035.1 unnamed protein product [Chondrus crispus]